MYSGGNNTDVSLPAHSGLKSTDPIWRLIRLEPFKTHTHTRTYARKKGSYYTPVSGNHFSRGRIMLRAVDLIADRSAMDFNHPHFGENGLASSRERGVGG